MYGLPRRHTKPTCTPSFHSKVEDLCPLSAHSATTTLKNDGSALRTKLHCLNRLSLTHSELVAETSTSVSHQLCHLGQWCAIHVLINARLTDALYLSTSTFAADAKEQVVPLLIALTTLMIPAKYQLTAPHLRRNPQCLHCGE